VQADPSQKYAPPATEATTIEPPAGFRVWHFMIVVVLCALVFGFFLGGSIFLAAVVFIGIVIVFARRRATNQDALLDILAIAAERGVPLGPAVEAFAESSGGRFRRWADTLAGLLNSGVPLADALNVVPRILPPDARLLIRVGGDAGLLPGALREASAARRSRGTGHTALLPRFSYLILVLLVMQVISGFILYFIVPKFEAIFHDFHVSLPPVTIFVIRASHVVVGSPLLGVLILAEVLLLLHLPFAYFGWSGGYLPGIDRFLLAPFDRLLVRRHSAVILRALASGTEAGRPLTRVLNTLAEYHPSGWVGQRVGRVLDDVRKGADCWKSLRDHGLIRPADAAVLEAASRVGNLPWALRQTAESGERRLGYRLQLWLQLLFPAVVLAMGGLVGLLVAAFFLPLITLIRALTS
jgi:type II secretory pathway component PulF